RSLTKSVFEVGFFSNIWVFGGAGIMIVLQLVFTYVPVMNTAFQSSPISLEAWARILAASSLVVVVVGIEKWTVRNKAKKVLS
ncbi:MAG: cation transporting ATPase C-terminal domain-containing protein, partial [Smithellaceae bacterium]